MQDLDRRWKAVIKRSRGNVEMEEKRRRKHHHALTSYLTGFTPISEMNKGAPHSSYLNLRQSEHFPSNI